MRFTHIPLALLLAAPALAGAQDRSRPPPPSSPAPSARAEPVEPSMAQAARPPRPPPPSDAASPRPPPPHPTRPPPPPGGQVGGPGWHPPPPIYYPPPFWAGYGWGWGYYPLYPVYTELGPAYAVPTTPPAHQMAATMRATASFGPRDTGMAGMAFAVDGRAGGFDMEFDAFQPSTGGVTDGGMSGSTSSYGYGSAHFTYALLQGPSHRFRLEAGGSWLTVPDSPYGSGSDAFGVDLGASATFGLFGPLGVEGHARFTPYPVQVVDLRGAAALRGGPLSLTFGYRVIDVAADSQTGPAARFEGPEIGLGLVF